MLRRFLNNKKGNYALATAVLAVPLLGAVGLVVDYTGLTRERAEVQNALDASCVATGRRSIDGATDEELVTYAKDFFKSNLRTVKYEDTEVTVTLPDSDVGGGILTIDATFNFKPKVMPAFNSLMGKAMGASGGAISSPVECDVRLKNTSEIALVLDNSGSMDQYGGGSSKKRIVLLKEAATYLVQELARQSARIKQVEKPVQFSVVPFSASVNIGPTKQNETWMDTTGISPVHHENFDWTAMTETNAAANGNRWVQKIDNVWFKRGGGWGDTKDDPVTRFSLYADMKYYSTRERVATGSHQEWICDRYKRGACTAGHYETVTDYTEYDSTPLTFADWQGCVEERPYPLNVNDTAPTASNPASLFVPMFAPDEPGNLWRDINGDGVNEFDGTSWSYGNSWWSDYQSGTSNAVSRQKDMQKYFKVKPYGTTNPGSGDGPNSSCTTAPITALTDVTTTAGMTKIVNAINAMAPTGNTNVPEGMAWGWRTVSSTEPFSEGRAVSEKGNDKVLIVLTDGLNTYGDLSDGDAAGNKSSYAAYGYTGVGYNGTSTPRLYMGTGSGVSKTTFSSTNYTKAMNEHMDTLCTNAKAAGLIVFTVGLDLDSVSDSAAISSLSACASPSKFRKNADGSYKRLFWNTKGSDLLDVFKTIADELSNLRIVG